jgi:hypothetical protein
MNKTPLNDSVAGLANLTGFFSFKSGDLLPNEPSMISWQVTLYSVIFASIFAFIFLFGILTNLLVIGVFILRSEFRQFTNFFFINLSIADILVLLFCIPITITDLFSPDEWHYGQFYCKVYTFFEYCVTTVSSFTIISISVERYYAVTKPLEVCIIFYIYFGFELHSIRKIKKSCM